MKESIFPALLFVFSLSVFAHDSITKHQVSGNGIIQWYKKKTNELTKLTKDMNPTNNSIQMSSQNLSTDMNNINRNKRDTQCISTKKPSTQLPNNEKKNHTASSIMDSLNQGTANIKYSDDPNIILLLGLSGAGKSTLAQYLFGNNSNLRSVEKKNFKCQPTGDFYIEDTDKKIGHNPVLSHTELPDLVIDPETNTTIYDCPGFSDTRDPEHDISGAYFIKAVSDKAKTLKFIFVVNYNSITMGGNREEFITLARHATNLIRNISKYNESIALVATKIKDDKSDDQRIIAIVDFLQEVRQTLNETNKEPNVQLFIDILLTTSGPENQNYTKIGFMPKFDTAGRLSDLLAVQAHKKSLLTLIHNNIKFTEINTTDLKPTISSDSVYYIDGLVNEVTQQKWFYIKNIVQKVQEFYNVVIQNMLDTIHSFNDEKIVINTDQSKAKLFVTKLNTGLSVISEVVRNIQKKTTLNELSKYIISSALISEVNVSQDIVLNISTQHEYLKFLLSVHEPNHSFNVDAVITLFTNLENQLMVSIDHFRNNVTDVTNQIVNTISSIDNNVMNEIQKNFSRIQETVFDNTKMSLLLNSGRSELLKIRDSANGPDITYKCIEQIQKTLDYFNFKGTNIKYVVNIIQNTSNLVDQLNFLETLKHRFSNSNSLECTDEINRVISYLDDSSKWNGMLTRLFEKLSEYNVQKNISQCNDLSKSIMNHKAPARVADVIPKLFVDRCFSVDEYTATDINNFELDKFKLDALKRVIKYTLYHNSSISPNPKSLGHLVMKGQYIKLSDLKQSSHLKNATLVEIFALKKVFIDADIDKTGEKFSLCIIAPIWEIYGEHKIKLDGKPGDAYTKRKAANGSKLSITNGTDGAPGLPGGPGGNFLGVGATFIDSHYLSISVDGGTGGPGQDGGDGMPGQNDTECPPTIKDKNFSNKEHCLSYRLISFGSLYDEGCTANSTYDGFSLNITVKNDWCQVVTCYPKNDWQFKGNGTNGGNGGKGGIGGHAGNITLIAKVKQSINMSKQIGKTGSDGNGGVGGEARKVGNNLVIDMVRTRFSGMCLPSIQDFSNEHKFFASTKSYFPGNAGTNGLNTENRKDPEKALSPPNFAHQSATDYKTFFRNYSSENPKDVNVKNFLDFF